MSLPIFFDRFGLIAFLYIIIDAIYDLFFSKDRNSAYHKKQRWKVWLRFFIGVVGVIVDGFLVIAQDFFNIIF